MTTTATYAAAFVLVLAACGIAHGQSSDAVDLARLCVNELGLATPEEDAAECAAISAVIDARAEAQGWSRYEAMRRYSSSVFDMRRSRRRWVAWLDPALGEPRYWPEGVSWDELGRPAWATWLRVAGDILRGDIVPACQPSHWGARYGIDHDRAERAIAAGRWARVECGATRNAFYRVR